MGSSKKVTVAYRIFLGMHKIYCHGPVDRLMEIKVDGRVAWSGVSKGGPIQIAADSLFGGEKREGGISGRVDFETGASSQGQNDYLQSKLGADIPAFRGVAGLVLRQCYLGLNPYLKRWSARMKRIHVRQDGLPQWYDQKAEINGDEFSADPDAYTQEYPGTLYSIAYDADTGVWLGAGSTSAYLRSTNGGKDWSAPIGPTGYSSKEVAVSGAVAVCSSGDFSGCWVSYNGGASFSPKAIPAPFGTGNTRLGCVGYGNGTWMIGGQYAGYGYVTVSVDSADTWSPIPGSGGHFVGGYPVVSVCHVEGTRWLCCDSFGRVHVSTTGGAYWSETPKLITQKLRKLPIGVVAIHTTPSLSISKDGGITWGPQVGLPFQPYDVAHLGGMLVAVGAGGHIALSYDQGVSWETLPQTLANGNNLLSIASDGDGLAYAVGAGGTVAKIVITPARRGDMNPAHIIRECLTDPDWGMGYQESDIDDASFTAAADRLFAEQMGISILWEKQTTIEDFVREILRHIDGALYVDRRIGKFVLNLVRADYNIETLPVLDESNIERVENYARPQPGDLFNSITVNYWDSNTGNTATLTADDPAMIQIFGQVKGSTVQYPGFTNANIAGRVARRDLRAMSTPLLSATLHITRGAAQDLNPGDAFAFEWPDLHEGRIVMRVTQMGLGDGQRNTVKVAAVEDVFALPDTTTVAEPDDEWDDPSQPPEPAQYRAVVELPYYELVQRIGQENADEQLTLNPDLGFVIASAARPANAINAVMSVDAGAGYEDAATIDFCPFAQLASDVTALATTIPIVNGTDMDLLVVGTHAQIGDELVRIDEIHDDHLVVGRAILDTIPAAHPAGTALLAWDQFADVDTTEYVSGETIDVKVRPMSGAGMVELADAATDTLTFAARAIRPYRPGNLKGNDEYQPGEGTWPLVLTWAHRNRLQDTAGEPVGYYEGSITSEPGVTYSVRVVELDINGAEGDILHTETGINAETASIPFSVVELSEAPAWLVGVKAVRDGVESFTEARLLIPGALQAPTGLTATVETY